MGSFDEEIIAKPKMLVVMDSPSNDQREEVHIVKLADFFEIASCAKVVGGLADVCSVDFVVVWYGSISILNRLGKVIKCFWVDFQFWEKVVLFHEEICHNDQFIIIGFLLQLKYIKVWSFKLIQLLLTFSRNRYLQLKVKWVRLVSFTFRKQLFCFFNVQFCWLSLIWNVSMLSIWLTSISLICSQIRSKLVRAFIA